MHGKIVFLGQGGLGDEIKVPIPSEVGGVVKWQKEWVHEHLKMKESDIPRMQGITVETESEGVACNMMEKMNGENVIYTQSREMEVDEKRVRESWDQGEKETKRQGRTPENPPKILRRNKPQGVQPAAEKSPRPQPEKMWNTLRESVNIGELSKRTLDAPVPGVTVRELLSISPDLIQQWFGVKRVPPLEAGKEPDSHVYSIKWKEAMRKLYACASPKCRGRVDDMEFDMLIDSGAELCLMSKEVFDELGLPIDLAVDWQVGSANSQKTKAHGICHDVPVMVGGFAARCRCFVLESLSQDIILGRLWERMVRAKHDNRDDRSCFTTIYDKHGNAATFCSVPAHHERNRAEASSVTTTNQQHQQDQQDKQQSRKDYYASDGGRVIFGSSAIEEIHEDDEGNGFRVRYETVGEVNHATVIDQDDNDGIYENDAITISRKVVEARALYKARTLYKRKKDKIRPANQPHMGGLKPGVDEDWKLKLAGHPSPVNAKYPWLIPKFLDMVKGTRLTKEHIDGLKIAKGVSQQEKDVLMKVLFNREAGITFDFTEKEVFKPEVEPPHIVPVIPHEAWQAASFRVPKALEGEMVDIVKKKLECGALERCCGPYRNPWFLVPKKSGGYQLINAAQRLNAVSIKDASLPPSADEFREEFAGFPLLSLLDLFSGYDQCELDLSSRDMTALQKPLGLLRMTALPQGCTNGVQVFDQVMKKILKDQIAAGIGKPFIDDVAVKPASHSMFLDKNGVPEEVVP